MMSESLILAMAAGMGIYQGVNPQMAWLIAVGRGLQQRSLRQVLIGTWDIALGHFLAMAVLLVPVAILAAFLMSQVGFLETLREIGLASNFLLIGFGLYKLYRPNHPRIVSRISPNRPIRWSFMMGMLHCGSPIMMVPMLINLLLMDHWFKSFGVSAAGHVLAYVVLAVIICAAMVIPLFTASSAIAVTVYERFGLKTLTRYWINLDLGWAFLFIAMGAMGIGMSLAV